MRITSGLANTCDHEIKTTWWSSAQAQQKKCNRSSVHARKELITTQMLPKKFALAPLREDQQRPERQLLDSSLNVWRRIRSSAVESNGAAVVICHESPSCSVFQYRKFQER